MEENRIDCLSLKKTKRNRATEGFAHSLIENGDFYVGFYNEEVGKHVRSGGCLCHGLRSKGKISGVLPSTVSVPQGVSKEELRRLGANPSSIFRVSKIFREMAPRNQVPHVVIFPFMAKGHTIPLLDFTKTLSSKGLRITIVTTPSNSPFIHQATYKHPSIRLVELEFPLVDGLPKGCESTDRLPSMDLYITFMKATRKLQSPFERFMRQLSDARDLPVCVISDFFLGWTLAVCREFDVPRLVFHGMGAFSMAVVKSVLVHSPHKNLLTDYETFTVPQLPKTVKLSKKDLPDDIIDFDPVANPFCKFLVEIGESEVDSWGVLVNSSSELERDFIEPLESFYRNGAKAWCVGPMLLYNEMDEDKENQDDDEISIQCTEWLDKRATGTVIYVSFGTQTHASDKQLDEIALGLEMSGSPFIWVIRSKTWTPPEEIEEKINGRGLIVRNWAPQRRILTHPATGGFLSHCGWNSVLESLSMGIPMLTWPMIAEQHLNAKYVVDELEAGVKIPIGSKRGEEAVVGWAAVANGVKELMVGENGRRAREKAQELKTVVRLAVHEGGSSDETLEELLKLLTNRTQ